MEKTKPEVVDTWRNGEIILTPDPDYDALPQTEDSLINKEVKRIAKAYPEVPFSELLDLARSIIKAELRGDI